MGKKGLLIDNNYHKGDIRVLIHVLFENEIHRDYSSVEFLILPTIKLELVTPLWDSGS